VQPGQQVTSAMQITVYRTTAGFAALAAEWDTLLNASQADSLFLTHTWQTLWWEHYHPGELCLVAARDADGRLVGLAPLFWNAEERSLQTVGCVDVSDYLDWIVAAGSEATVYPALLDTLLTHPDVPAWEVLAPCNVPQDSVSLQWLPELARQRGLETEVAQDDVCPLLTLPGSWDEYLQTRLNKKQRHELRRKLRRGPELAWYQVGPEHDLTAQVDLFVALMQKSHPEKAHFIQDSQNRAFFYAIAQATQQTGWLQLNFLTWQAEPIAAFFNFLYRNRVLVYNSGFDPAYAIYSPGIALMARIIQQAIERRYAVVDFMRGDESYKYDLGGVDTTVHRLFIRRPL